MERKQTAGIRFLFNRLRAMLNLDKPDLLEFLN